MEWGFLTEYANVQVCIAVCCLTQAIKNIAVIPDKIKAIVLPVTALVAGAGLSLLPSANCTLFQGIVSGFLATFGFSILKDIFKK